jgi:hypothetical protein
MLKLRFITPEEQIRHFGMLREGDGCIKTPCDTIDVLYISDALYEVLKL